MLWCVIALPSCLRPAGLLPTNLPTSVATTKTGAQGSALVLQASQAQVCSWSFVILRPVAHRHNATRHQCCSLACYMEYVACSAFGCTLYTGAHRMPWLALSWTMTLLRYWIVGCAFRPHVLWCTTCLAMACVWWAPVILQSTAMDTTQLAAEFVSDVEHCHGFFCAEEG